MPVYVPNTTWVDGSGGGTPLSAARLNNMELGISPPYLAYTPTWTSTGTAPVIGNAVVTARYVQIGKFVHAYGAITFGSTSTFGTGAFLFALPVTSTATTAGLTIGTCMIQDTSSTNRGTGLSVEKFSATVMSIEFGATYLGAISSVGQIVPWTWAVSDIIAWNLVYEAA